MQTNKQIKIAVGAALAAILTLTVVRGVARHGAVHAVAAEKPAPLTLIIDAGHGGEDGGAVTKSGLTESGLNLDIALRADALAAFFGVKTVLTRDSETLYYSPGATTTRQRKAEDQKRRLALINGTDNAVFLSIHQNMYTKPAPYGAQVLYAKTDGSAELGATMQELLVQTLDASNRRAAERVGDTILLMNYIDCPAVLVECGFLSNPNEEALLRSDAYRLKLAAILTAGFLQQRDELLNLQNTM
ncbi:MAG: N-acetylmuramoyl-L-alanine amidase [Oscillospiraceae bacterium]|jgi:N-acetylmuramoyl-L-alanine amidase|nr:N-acetylmuramoyl-L-alanine amidase [Oscillospiraceae bacterium]